MAKAQTAAQARRLQDIPNIGPAMEADLRLLGVAHPAELATRDPDALYAELCQRTGLHQDPCVLDTLVAAVRFMQGGPPLPWWHYSALRKARGA